MILDILCRVIDNYGDIGVAWRLCRAFSELAPDWQLRLILDKTEILRQLESQANAESRQQTVRGIQVVSWEQGPAQPERFAAPDAVVEAFSCGRPQWYDTVLARRMLVSKQAPLAGLDQKTTCSPGLLRIVALEYLTAEEYAVDFHRMRAATGVQNAIKHFFMPGFVQGTGGLILDRSFTETRQRCLSAPDLHEIRSTLLAAHGLEPEPEPEPEPKTEPLVCPTVLAQTPKLVGQGRVGKNTHTSLEHRYWVLIFSYERNYDAVVASLAELNREQPVLALVAAGKSSAGFISAWEKAGRPYPALFLPFVDQETWDQLLLASDFTIVRGEESLSRAVLSGRPFLWQAYPQEEKHHLVKVRALLHTMRPFFTASAFEATESAYIAFNDRETDHPEECGSENIGPLLVDKQLADGFRAFSDSALALGNLAEHLMTFLCEIC